MNGEGFAYFAYTQAMKRHWLACPPYWVTYPSMAARRWPTLWDWHCLQSLARTRCMLDWRNEQVHK